MFLIRKVYVKETYFLGTFSRGLQVVPIFTVLVGFCMSVFKSAMVNTCKNGVYYVEGV